MAEQMSVARRIAEEILGVLPAHAIVVEGEDSRSIRFRIRRSRGWKLEKVLFSTGSLEKLAADPDRGVKVEYLQREIARTISSRREYLYPRSARPRRVQPPPPVRLVAAARDREVTPLRPAHQVGGTVELRAG
jgi:hypothetical protein